MANSTKDIDQYVHSHDSRTNNPPIGLVTPETDKDGKKKTYKYDYHIDPQLEWAGKAERTSFEVPTVSLHVHERIDPKSIIEKIKKKDESEQISFFSQLEENLPIREAIEFYKHKQNWSNRLIAGDSLLVMNSLLEKEGMAEKVQMVYFDPPYGIRYGSNFQPFINKRDVKDGKDEDLTTEPEMIKAFRDTWELGIHSYLSYIRDRLLLARDLLKSEGSIFVQISDENLHHIREILDEVFGAENFIALIAFKKKKMPLGESFIFTMCDYIIWYGKDKKQTLFNKLFLPREVGENSDFSNVELNNGKVLSYTDATNQLGSIPKDAKYFQSMDLRSSGRTESCVFEYEFEGKKYYPSGGRSWKTNFDGMKKLEEMNRLYAPGETLRYKFYYEDYPVQELSHMWMDLQGATNKTYVVQTAEKAIERCILMASRPGDLVLDITCGSGTTAYISEQFGRRWITCDTSRIALNLTKQRLMTGYFDYFKLAQNTEGIDSGFIYKTVPHITLGSITNNEPSAEETLYDQPIIDNTKLRVTGPFTVEAVPAPVAHSMDEIGMVENIKESDESVIRTGETLRQTQWRDELQNTGIRGKNGQYIKFARIEPMQGTKYIQAEGETLPENGEEGKRVLIAFGPEYTSLDQRQVELALQEAGKIKPRPDIILFIANLFEAEAAQDIDETNWPGIILLRAQMNADLFTDDLKKNRSSNDSFWLIGQPDVQIEKVEGKYQVSVLGFDYYDTKSGNLNSGSQKNIAMWMLDTDYDGRSIYPSQVFFPMAGEKEGWSKLAKNLRGEIDEELVEAFRGVTSIPFKEGKYHQIAVKIVDDRGIESLKVIKL